MNRNKKETQQVYYLANRSKIRAYQAAYHKTHKRIRSKEESRNSNLRFNYGITLSQYEEFLASQNGQCVGCLKHENEFKKALSVDHDHKTGSVRGLLCVRCNRILGLCFDNASILLNLIDYLKGAKP
jgi:hypothetical protein